MFFLTDLFVISLLLCSWKELAASLGQKCEKLLVIGDALRHQIVVCGAGVRGCLLDQLANIVPRRAVAIWSSISAIVGRMSRMDGLPDEH
jgi:hypothetical protein